MPPGTAQTPDVQTLPGSPRKDGNPRVLTLQDIAAACGVSATSVSQCLRDENNPRFSEKTRMLIQETARKMGYVPNLWAAGLREGRTNFLSMVVPWNTPEMLDAAETEAKLHGFTLAIHFSVSPDLDAERTALRHAIAQRVDGLLWLPSDTAWKYTRTLELIRTTGTRTAFLESALPGLPDGGLVEIDYRTPMRQALDQLVATGCRTLIMLATGTNHRMRAGRVEFLREYCTAQALDCHVIEGQDPEQIHEILSACGTGAGILCGSDWIGLRVLDYARSAGIRIPEDLQVLVIGDILVGGQFRITEICSPKMSAIRRPSGEMARTAVRLLIDNIASGERQPVGHRLLQAEYIPRETTLPATT